LYQQVLRADPDNAVAAHGLDQVGDALATQARKAFDAQDTATANTRIEQLAALQPNNGALPSLRALQAQIRQQQSAALDAALTQGTQALRDGRISGDGDDTALAHFKAALALDPNNPRARAGLGKVAQALTVQANAAIDAGDRAQARQLLEQAAALAPKSADLAAAQARLGSAVPKVSSPAAPVASGAPGGGAGLVTPTLSAKQQAAVAHLIERARQATQQGQIMLPPGASAYDLYRNALSIDGNNVAARQGLQGLPGEVEKQFRRALSRGNLSQAGEMLDNLAELSPGDASQSDLSNQLATAWLDQAEQQLGRGDRYGARQSLEQARKLAPNHPRVQDLTARLQGGS
jgi:tetratricopeptide (TPR) repeat protein